MINKDKMVPFAVVSPRRSTSFTKVGLSRSASRANGQLYPSILVTAKINDNDNLEYLMKPIETDDSALPWTHGVLSWRIGAPGNPDYATFLPHDCKQA